MLAKRASRKKKENTRVQNQALPRLRNARAACAGPRPKHRPDVSNTAELAELVIEKMKHHNAPITSEIIRLADKHIPVGLGQPLQPDAARHRAHGFLRRAVHCRRAQRALQQSGRRRHHRQRRRSLSGNGHHYDGAHLAGMQIPPKSKGILPITRVDSIGQRNTSSTSKSKSFNGGICSRNPIQRKEPCLRSN